MVAVQTTSNQEDTKVALNEPHPNSLVPSQFYIMYSWSLNVNIEVWNNLMVYCQLGPAGGNQSAGEDKEASPPA